MPEGMTAADPAETAPVTVKEQSSSDKSLTGATPTPTEPTPTPTPNEQDPAATTTTQAGEQPGADQPTKAPWFQKRIDQLTWEKNEERRNSAALAEQNKSLLAQLEAERTGRPVTVTTTAQPSTGTVQGAPTPAVTAGQPAFPPMPPTATAPAQKPQVSMSEAEVQARAVIMARELSAKAEFDKACNKIALAGKETYADFDQSLKTFEMLGGIPQATLDAIIDMPNGHKVLYAIGKDPELADRLVKMPAARMGMELARVEASLAKAPKVVSGAPKPITPIDQTATASDDPEKMSTQEWISWREKTKKTRW